MVGIIMLSHMLCRTAQYNTTHFCICHFHRCSAMGCHLGTISLDCSLLQEITVCALIGKILSFAWYISTS